MGMIVVTEKQYKVGYFEDPTNVDDYVECDGEYLDASDIVRILKKLQEENERLKKENDLKGDFRNFINEDIVRIKKENEQLKQEIDSLRRQLTAYRKIKRLVKDYE